MALGATRRLCFSAMPDGYKATEFGGKPDKLGSQPHPHKRASNERLHALYRTGEEQGTEPDGGEAFVGLLDENVQRAARQAEGVLDKGQVWEALQNG